MRPEDLTDDKLYADEVATGLPLRLAYLGLPTACSRYGVFIWGGPTKAQVLPHDPVDFYAVLEALQKAGLVARFTTEEGDFGVARWFLRDQQPHPREGTGRWPLPPAELLPEVLRHHLPQDSLRPPKAAKGEPDPDPVLGSRSMDLDPPIAPRGLGAPPARGGIDLSVFDQANRAHVGRGLLDPERLQLERYLREGHPPATLLELMDVHAEMATSSLVGYALRAYTNGGGHVPKSKRRHVPWRSDRPEYVPEQLTPEEEAELERQHAELQAALREAAAAPAVVDRSPAPPAKAELSDEEHARLAAKLRQGPSLAMGVG